MIATIFFYCLRGDPAGLRRDGGRASRNPVHSVLFLILAFFNAAALFLIAGAEFLAMILVIVYVGAVAVLFLFVVMMLDIDFARIAQRLPALPAGRRRRRRGAVRRAAAGARRLEVRARAPPTLRLVADAGRHQQHRGARPVLYTDYVFLFQAAGLILLVAMIGAIVLTLARPQDLAAPEHPRADRTHRRPKRWRLVGRCRLGAGDREDTGGIAAAAAAGRTRAG